MNKTQNDEDSYVDFLLQFHSELSQQDFTPQLMAQLEKSAKVRQKITLIFSIIAVMISGLLFIFLNIESTLTTLFSQQSIYIISLLLFCFVGNCFWLLIEEK
jgi:hypothetical protein